MHSFLSEFISVFLPCHVGVRSTGKAPNERCMEHTRGEGGLIERQTRDSGGTFHNGFKLTILHAPASSTCPWALYVHSVIQLPL